MATTKRQNKKNEPTAQKKKRKTENLGLAKTDLTIGEIRRALKKGQEHAERAEWPEAVKHLLKAWEAFPEDLNILTVLAHALTQLGVREHAIYVLERALHYHEPTADVCSVIQQLALEMGFNAIAEKLGHQLVAMEPTVAKHYINLLTALNRQDKYTESIDMAQQVLPLFPENSDLWNVLASAVRYRDGNDASVVFYEEALRLDPKNYKVLSNLASAMPGTDRAFELTHGALAQQPENPELHINMALEMFRKGQLKQAFEHYSHRLSSRRVQAQNITYTHKLPEWDGSSLKGKSLFVTAEQGIGDEVMFGNYLPYLYEQAEKLYIGVDRRLVSLMQRRFPNAVVDGYTDRMTEGYRYRVFMQIQKSLEDGAIDIDYAIPLGSCARYAWHVPEDVKAHPDGFLKPNPDRAAEFGKQVAHLKDKPIIGLAWRSGLSGGVRRHRYSTVDDLAPLAALKDKVHFVNLMYTDVTDDLKEIKDKHGIDIFRFEDTDLKQDIEANVAIMAHCDLVVAACTAPGMFSLSSGRPTILFESDAVWWGFGSDDHVLFAKDADFICGRSQQTFKQLIERVAARVQEKLGL
ncbi:tetratricopeptide repeat protein [Kordiimonas sp.]|uniref:tetratricopeptide repeat protein n=1 Tax=Kordiimonas sp. TaxID=1970157 RepID=UPI003A905A22